MKEKKGWKLRDLRQEQADQTAIFREWMRDATDPRAEVARFQVTSKLFAVRLMDSGSNRVLYLWCGGCYFLGCPTGWPVGNMEIFLSKDEYSKLVIRDTASDFEVQCQAVEFSAEFGWFIEGKEILSNPTDGIAAADLNSQYFKELLGRRVELDSRSHIPSEVENYWQEWRSQFESIRIELWSYREDGRRLDVRVEVKGANRNLHIVCCGCHFFQSHTWRNFSEVDLQFSPDSGGRYRLVDAGAGCLIECDFVQLATDLVPLTNSF